MTYRRILVPVDGSRASLRGLREAIRLAKGQRSRLRVVHVVDETALLGAAEAGADAAALVRSKGARGRRLVERARRAADRAGLRGATAIRESAGQSAARGILAEAKRWRADLIVMGTHGRRGVRRMVLGSDAEEILRRADVPVLLVRARED